MQCQLQVEPRQDFQLRPYQEQAIAGIRSQLSLGSSRTLVAMATGLGKTVVFASLPGALGLPGRWLVLAHRSELLDQAASKLRAVNPELHVEVEQAHRRAGSADVVVASVQTLQGRRLERLDPEEFAAVIVDEAHHATAPSYRKILRHFGVDAPGGARPLIGVTATPRRGDGVGLGAVFDSVSYEMGLRDGIEQEWLAPLSGWRIETGESLASVSWRAGDFVAGQLAGAVDTDARNQLVVREYQDKATGRRALAFCASVAHAERMAEAFVDRGVSAACISGETPADARAGILQSFAAGKLQVIANCGVLTEGFDDPGVSCILMARPTGSSLLYQQIVGRGTRRAPGKEDCLVLDFVDNSSKHGLASLAGLLDLPGAMDLRGRGAVETAKEVERVKRETPWIDTDKISSVEDLETAATRIEFFSQAVPDELDGVTTFEWRRAGGGYQIHLPGQRGRPRESLVVARDRLGAWSVSYESDGEARGLSSHSSAGEAIRWADRRIGEIRPESARLVNLSSPWRKQSATPKQLELLRRLKVAHPPEINRGQASGLITMALQK